MVYDEDKKHTYLEKGGQGDKFKAMPGKPDTMIFKYVGQDMSVSKVEDMHGSGGMLEMVKYD